MSGHTPGPWKVRSNRGTIPAHGIYGPDGRIIIGMCSGFSLPDTPETIANVELIAAAPETAAALERAKADIAELVAALTKIADGRSGNNVFCDMRVLQRVARAALAKHARAEGSGDDDG